MYYIKDENGKVFGRYYSQSNALNALQFLEGTGAILFDSDDNIIARAKEKQLKNIMIKNINLLNYYGKLILFLGF